MKQLIKQLLIPKGRKLRKVRGGLAKGMLMQLDLLTQFQRYLGLDEREILPALLQVIPLCRSLVDVGANDGRYTLAFLRSPAERIIACEPSGVIEQLLSNALANGYQPDRRFTLERRLIGQGDGWLGVSELVQDLPRPILLKVDIEGGEVDLLHTAETCPFLRELHWVIETHSEELENQCIDWFKSNGYQTRIIKNAPWRILLPEQRSGHNRWLIAEPVCSHDNLKSKIG